MAFKKPVINKITTDIKDLTIFLRTQRKWGKSTLYRDVVIEKYGDASHGLSVSCGKERGAKLLDDLNLTEIESYKDAAELKNWLISEKGKEHDIKLISFDTVDEMIPLFETETVRQSKLQSKNQCKTINGAFGGYGNGQLYTANLIKEYFDDLHQAGFGIWAISHTKFKTLKEKGGLEEDGYNVLTSNIFATYESAIGDIFDCTLTGIIDRDVVEKTVKSGDDEKIKRYATDSIRKLYFRGTPMIEAGCRMSSEAVPEYMIFDKANMAHDFIKTVEDGMKFSKVGNKKTADEKKEATKVEVKKEEVLQKDVSDNIDGDILSEQNNSNYPDNLIEETRNLFQKCKVATLKSEVREIVKSFGKFTDVPETELKELYDKLSA